MERFLQNLLTASIHGSILIFAVLLLRLVLLKTPKKYIWQVSACCCPLRFAAI